MTVSQLERMLKAGEETAVIQLHAEITEVLSREPLDVRKLGELGHKALMQSTDAHMMHKRAYEELYWMAEERLLSTVTAGQQG